MTHTSGEPLELRVGHTLRHIALSLLAAYATKAYSYLEEHHTNWHATLALRENGKTYAEIAAIQNINLSNVKMRLFRARRILERYFRESCFPPGCYNRPF